MFVSYKLNLDRPGTYLVPGCDGQVVLYPVIAHDDDGNDVEFNRLRMDKSSTIDINTVILDEKLHSDDLIHPVPLVTIVNSHVSGSIRLTRGGIAHSNVSATGIIDTSRDIINSKLEGHIAVEENASIISSRTGIGSTVLVSNNGIIETSEINGTLMVMRESAIYASIINTRIGTSSMSGHASLIKCKMEHAFRLQSNVVVYNGDIIYGIPIEGYDDLGKKGEEDHEG